MNSWIHTPYPTLQETPEFIHRRDPMNSRSSQETVARHGRWFSKSLERFRAFEKTRRNDRVSVPEFAALRIGKAGCLCILGAEAIAGMADVGRGRMPCENQTREQLRAVSPVTGRMPWDESKLGVPSPLSRLHLRATRPRSESRRGKIESRSVSEVGTFDECSRGPIYGDLSEANCEFVSLTIIVVCLTGP